MLSRLARLTTRRPRAILVSAVALFALCVGVGAPVVGMLSTGDEFADPDSESERLAERVEAASGEEDAPGIIALVSLPAPVTDAASRGRIAEVEQALAADPGVTRVAGFDPNGDRTFLSRDGDTVCLVAFIASDADEDAVGERLQEELGTSEDVRIGGGAIVGAEVGDQVSEDLGRAELLAFPILFLLSLWVFRGFVAALLPLLVGTVTIFGTFLGLRLFNELTPLSIYALNLAIALGLGLAIDYSLFVVSRFREELQRSDDPRAAIGATLSTAGRTVAFSSLTVAVALLSLTIFPQRFLYSMGISGALTALIAAAVSLIILPAILVLLGKRVNALAPASWRRAGEREARAEPGGWYRLARAVMRRPIPVASITAAAMILLGLPFLRVEFTGIDASALPESSQARQVEETLRADFPVGRAEPITAVLGLPATESGQAEAHAASLAELEDVESVGEPRPLGDAGWLINVYPDGSALSDESLDLVDEIRSLPSPGGVEVTGDSARFLDQQASLGDSLPLALAILAVSTIVILFLMTGSLVLPLKALVMNLLTISAAFGILVLVFQDGRLEGLLDYTSAGAIESTQPLVLLAIVFGLSTDYGVFLLGRIKELHDSGASNEEAVALGLERTGRIITAAALLFTVAIGAFVTSEVIFIKQVGLGTAVAVIIDATIVRALLVPALMKLLGEWNWWAPAPLRRLHSRLAIRG